MTGIRLAMVVAIAARENVAIAVARMVSGVGICGDSVANTGAGMNMCISSMPCLASERGRTSLE